MTRVLVVDDNDANRYYLSSLLSGHGYEVDLAENGAQALEMALAAPPALVISDLLMPVMDGYTLLRAWRSKPELEHVPFVVYTATYTEPEDEQLARKLGADGFLRKPLGPEALLSSIRDVELKRSQRPDPKVPQLEEQSLLREYNEVLIRKLEQKSLALERANRGLQEDIALRERAERDLRESEARFRQLAETIDDVFFLTDRSLLEVVYVSPGYEKTWGRSRESLQQNPRDFLEALHPDDREHVVRSLEAITSGKWEETYRVVRPDGSQRVLRARAFPIKNEQGEVYRIAGVTRDVTEYVQLEAQLRQAQKLEAIARLASGVAHDFNNLLSVILSYTSIAIEDLGADDPVRADLEQVLRASDRAAELTRQLLAFSHQQVLRPKVIDLGQVLSGLAPLLRRVVGEGVELQLSSGPMHRVHADPSQMEQIIMNLVINARDAMPRGGRLRIELSDVALDARSAAVQAGAAPGSYVLLCVSDTGHGMDTVTRERIFEPFFTTKQKGKGTGLGLSTVFGIVRQSRGRIEVSSEPDHGSTFRVYLPATERELDRELSERPRPATLRGTEIILLVEDDEQVRASTSTILERHGYTVLRASHGEEALQLSELFEGPIDLLVTDVVMPRISGLDLAAHLCRLRPGLKVLYVSGYADGPLLEHGALAPDIVLLPKPITPDGLLSKVREVLMR